tara:strand:+ start:5483 stop:8656 length:3174 start_codon:yes stop_codon:yes gene_type:complete
MGRFEIQTRTYLFYTLVVLSILVLVQYIILPILGLINIKRNFGYSEAATLIGNHFPEVQDKLINTLQLQEKVNNSNQQLLIASIDQRIKNLSPISFAKAIPYKENIAYIKYALLPAILLLFILLTTPGFKKSSQRIVQYKTHFEIEAPFEFESDLEKVVAIQNEDIKIQLNTKGKQIPQDAYLRIGTYKYKMKMDKLGSFSYRLRNVQKTEKIYFEAGGFSSREYLLNVVPKPRLINTYTKLIYPKYLNLDNGVVENIGEINVPAGTIIEWNIQTKNVNRLIINPSNDTLSPIDNNTQVRRRFLKSSRLNITSQNNLIKKGDSINFSIRVSPDLYPSIEVNLQKDSLSQKILYFMGSISDDHGFGKLQFHYTHLRDEKYLISDSNNIEIPINLSQINQKFYHLWNLDAIEAQPDDKIEYYFKVWDNDEVNGSKYTQTPIANYKIPSLKEIEKLTEKLNQEIKESLNDAQSKSKNLEEQIKSVEKMLTEKKNLDWNDKRKIQELLEKKKSIQEKLKNSIQKNIEKNFKENEFNPIQEELLEKQKKLEKIMNDVLDDKTQKLMDKIQELLEKNKKDEIQNALQKLKFDEKQMNKEMDRLLELFKELELEKKLLDTIDKLNQLAKQEKKLASKTNKKGKDKAAEQEKLNKIFDEIKKDLKTIEQNNKDLEKPLNLNNHEDDQQSISLKMKDALSKEQQGKSKNASQKMNESAEQISELAQKMQQEMEEAYEEQQTEDYNNLRQILENLIQLSFDQEALIAAFKKNEKYSPKYVELRQDQRRIKDETKMVEDSLLALSKRNEQIHSFVNEEISKVNDNLDESIRHLGERITYKALVTQQYAMTGYNNLALMLTESLKQMQQQIKNQRENKGKPKGKCKKPGGAKNGEKPQKPNASAIKKMQDELAKQIKELEKGEKQGKGKPSSKQFAEMATKQAAIREKIQELNSKLQKEGKGGSLGDLKRTQDLMDQVEEDFYNKRLNIQTFYKLNQIEFKLSEHEKAEKEQEQDKTRSSKEGKEFDRPIPKNIEKYLEQKEKETEMIRKVSPELQPYYKQKVESYFEN